MPTTDPEAIAWINSRPKSIQKLMLRFPPACMVKLNDDAPLCEKHKGALEKTWVVVSYNEDGGLGIAASHADLKNRVHVKPHDIYVTGYQEGQDKDWIASILDGEQP